MAKKDLDFADNLEKIRNYYISLYKDIPKAMSVNRAGLVSTSDISECLITNTFIAGTSFYNTYHKLPPATGDIDFFFMSEEGAKIFEDYFMLVGLTPTKTTSNPYGADDSSENDISLEKNEFLLTEYSVKINLNPYAKPIINMIKPKATEATRNPNKESPSIIDFLDTFDFCHTRVFYDPSDETINMPDKTKFCIQNRVLSYTNRYRSLLKKHTDIKPSLNRAKKFLKRGFRFDEESEQFLKQYHGDACL